MTDKQDAKNTPAKPPQMSAERTAKGTVKRKPKPEKTTAQSASSTTNPIPNTTTSIKKGGGLASLLAVAALAIAAFAAYQSWLLGQQLQSSAQGFDDQLAAQQVQQQQVTQVSAAVTAVQANVEQQKQTFGAQQQRMDEALQQALQQMASELNQQQVQLPKWELAEAEYLLRLANQRLAMEQNPASALTLLQAADEIMHASEQLGSYGVRQAIAKDMAALTAVPVVDQEGIYARLAALMQQSTVLTYLAPAMPAKAEVALKENSEIQTNTAADNVDSMPLTWGQQAWQLSQQVFYATWQELSDLVRVQERVSADQLLLTPEVEGLLRMRMQLALSQAQIALLRGQQGLYQASLAQVSGLLSDYYRSSDPVAQAMYSQVKSLEQVQVMAQMPDISGSLYALQDLQEAIFAQQGAD